MTKDFRRNNPDRIESKQFSGDGEPFPSSMCKKLKGGE